MSKFKKEDFHEKIEITFNQYKILLIPEKESINISIQKNNSYDVFESDFNIKYLHKILMTSFSIKDIIDFISTSINKNNIEIKENNMNLKLIFISSIISQQNIELIIKKKIKITEEFLEMLVNQIEYIKSRNEKLEKRIESLEKENNSIKTEIIKNSKEINLKISNYEKIKCEIEERIKKLEKNNKTKETEILPSLNIKLNKIKSINTYYGFISSISSFPSGNIISVSYDRTIKIFDKNFNIIQIIENAHDSSIFNLDIQNENNFVTCSAGNSIKTWKKENNKFKLNNTIINAHQNTIYKVIYDSKGNLFSCSYDKKVKKWELKNNNEYQNIISFIHSSWVNSILLLEDKKLLISSGGGGTKFWNINNFECISYIKQAVCYNRNVLKRIDDDKIIIGANNFIQIISLSKKKIIKNFDNNFRCWGIDIIKDKGIFIVGGKSKFIKIYRNDNLECIQIIETCHQEGISGFCELIDKTIISFSDDKIINQWNFNYI